MADTERKHDPVQEDGSGPSGIQIASMVMGVAVLAFILGAVMQYTGRWPATLVGEAVLSVSALQRQQELSDNFATLRWEPARYGDESGLVRVDPERAWRAAMMYVSYEAAAVRLVDFDGTLLHEWVTAHSQVFADRSWLPDPADDDFIYIARAEPLPGGDILTQWSAVNRTPWGYGLARLDRDGKPVWVANDHYHHDFDVTADGRVIGLGQYWRDGGWPGARYVEDRFIDDELIILDLKTGEELQRWSIADAISASPFAAMMDRYPTKFGYDPQHTNSVEYVTAETAAAHDWLEEGWIVMCFRNQDAIAAFDPETGRVLRVKRGEWHAPHDPVALADGTFLLFDNLGLLNPPDRSRVIKVDPEISGIIWQWDGEPGRALWSTSRGRLDVQPNGNILVTETHGARAIEVTPSGDVVWEYINPVTATRPRDGVPVRASLGDAQKVDDAFADLFR